MDRSLISFNVPNLITVPLMAFLGFLLAALIYQAFLKFGPGADRAASTQGGY